MKRNFRKSLQGQILASLVGGGVVILSVLIGMWLLSRAEHQEKLLIRTLKNDTQNIGAVLLKTIEKQYLTTQIISHSLSLRRYVITHNRQRLNLPSHQLQKDIADLISHWQEMPDSDPLLQEMLESLEARNLKDIAGYAGDVIDNILVTDAFGIVLIATHKPVDIFVFERSWWQNALMMNPGEIYLDQELERGTDHYLWNLSVPLRNDEGTDAVGVVRIQLRLDRILQNTVQKYQQLHHSGSIHIITDRMLTYPPGPAIDAMTPEINRELKSYFQGIITLKDPDRYLAYRQLSSTETLFQKLNWTIVLEQPYTPVFSLGSPEIRRGLLVWLAGILYLILISLILARWITGPLNSLMHGVHEISKGNLKVRIPVSGSGEIRTLAMSFNKMVSKLRATSEQINTLVSNQTKSLEITSELVRKVGQMSDPCKIADLLVTCSRRLVNADAGVVLENRNSGIGPCLAHAGIPSSSLKTLEKECPHLPPGIYYGWSDKQLNAIWNQGYQILLIIPVPSQTTTIATLYLLFSQAFDMDIKSNPVLDLLALITGISITRAAYLKELTEEKSKIQAILEGISTFICTIDRDMTITWHNPYAQAFLGLDPNDILTCKYCYSRLRSRDKICPDCPVKKTFDDGQTHRIIQRWLLEDQTIRWIESFTSPLMDKDGFISAVVLMLNDVTEKMEENAALLRYSRALENIHEAVIITDWQGRVVYHNSAFSSLFDLENTAQQVSLASMFPPAATPSYHDIVRHTQSGQQWVGDIDLQSRAGRLFKASLSASIITDPSGMPSGLIFICTDVSSRRKNEAELVSRCRELDILHKVGVGLSQSLDMDSTLPVLIADLVKYAAAESGLIILTDEHGQDPRIAVSHELPEIFVKYIDEVKHGRSSPSFKRAMSQQAPVVFEDLQNFHTVEAKLMQKLGFQSVILCRLASADRSLGMLFLASNNPNCFSESHISFYQSIASLISVFINNCRAHSELIKTARLTTTGQLLALIGSDLQKIIHSLDGFRLNIDRGFTEQDFDTVSDGWQRLNLEVWKLSIVTSNLLDYSREFPTLFFPENIFTVTDMFVREFEKNPFAQTLDFKVNVPKDFPDVYLNRVSILKSLRNLMAVALDHFAWDKGNTLRMNVQECFPDIDSYSFILEYPSETSLSPFTGGAPGFAFDFSDLDNSLLAAAVIQKIAISHSGHFRQTYDPDSRTQRLILELPRYPLVK